MTDERQSLTHRFAISGHKGYVTMAIAGFRSSSTAWSPLPLRHSWPARGSPHWPWRFSRITGRLVGSEVSLDKWEDRLKPRVAAKVSRYRASS